MDNTDSAIKSLVCDACWSGIFSTNSWKALLAGEQVPGQTWSVKGITHKTTWADILAAADRDGCNWCRLFARLNLAATERDAEVTISVACDAYIDCTPVGKKLAINIQGPTGVFWANEYYMYTQSDDKAAKYVNARERITDVSSPQSYKLALGCMDHCVHNHVKCPPPQTTRLPDRVVDCSDVRKPKLVLTDGNQHGYYLTLSYVWGGPQPLTTTRNIDEYITQGLDISKFPQTIQDAVLDSDEDKKRQLTRMRDTYRNTYLTINVACAEGTHEGFLSKHRPQKVPDARIPYCCPDGSVGSVSIAKRFDTDVTDGSRSYWDELEPINYRGWCLQEKLLPPRSLIYASDTLKYFCQTETVNIGHALCEPCTVMRLPNIIYQPPASGDATLSDADRVVYRQAWLSVIFTYTLREISVPSDKLVALAGVAEQFHLVYKDQYLAGLWRKTLLLDLLWRRESVGQIRPRPISYRAPSWSWASIDGLIRVDYAESKLADDTDLRRVEILGCHVKLASEENPFGEVTGGTLRVKGLMKPVVLDRYHVLLTDQPINIGSVSFDAEEERLGNAYVILLVWNPLGSFSVGIVVVATGEDQHKYRRVGRFDSRSDHARSKDSSWLEGLSEQEIILV